MKGKTLTLNLTELNGESCDSEFADHPARIKLEELLRDYAGKIIKVKIIIPRQEDMKNGK